jgi:hypothetical protein
MRRSNPQESAIGLEGDCFASLAMTSFSETINFYPGTKKLKQEELVWQNEAV